MTAALQNPANHERIIQAGQHVRGMIGGAYIGRGGAISADEAMRTIENPQGVADEMYAHGIPDDFKAIDKILEEANQPDRIVHEPPVISLDTFRKLHPPVRSYRKPLLVAAIVALVAAIVFLIWYATADAQQMEFTVPSPNLSAEACSINIHGDVTTIRCDAARVCPTGWHLHTVMLHPLTRSTLAAAMGYGDAGEVINSCQMIHGAGITDDGGIHYVAEVGIKQ